MAIGDTAGEIGAGSDSGVERFAAEESRTPEIGRELGLGILGVVVAISTDDDRLNREVKLERFDFELSVRTGDCLTGDALGEAGCSADVAD